MNKEQLEALQARAKEATEVAAELEKLQEADPYKSGHKATFTTWNTGDNLLGESLLKKVLAAGRLVVIAEFEAKLSSLLGLPVAVAKDVIEAEEVQAEEVPVPS